MLILIYIIGAIGIVGVIIGGIALNSALSAYTDARYAEILRNARMKYEEWS